MRRRSALLVAPPRRPGESSALRRYPAYGYLVGVAALALLLPSGLTVPQSGPPTLAEYAPVPGQGQGGGDTSRLGLPTTGGLGAGGSGTVGRAAMPGDAPDDLPGRGELIRKPGSKRCVGSPPRQTEDPLSPPCIAHFEGDNFGATAKGVTRDEVVVLMQLQGTYGDRRAGEVVDCAEPVTSADVTQDHLCKAFMKFFNDRYQTYDRVVHLYNVHSEDLETELKSLNERYRPFAFVGQGVQGRLGKELDILAAGYTSGTRQSMAESAPYGIGFRPDADDMATMAATYVCTKLASRPARYAGDAASQGQARRFGFWSSSSPTVFDNAVTAAIERDCGLTFAEQAYGGTTDQTAAARFKTAGVTTVLVAAGDVGLASMTQQATRAQWFPEWIVPGSASFFAANINYVGRLADPLQWRNAFAITVDYRRPAIPEQTWYRAFREGCPDCPEPSLAGGGGASGAAFTYDALTMLFYGIQAAGPRLTVANVDKGLHAIPPRGSADPFTPAAYFAPGNHSFLKDATGMWWDSTGQAPGTTERGCWRLAHQGRRFRPGEWLRGDDDLRASGPCQGDVFKG